MRASKCVQNSTAAHVVRHVELLSWLHLFRVAAGAVAVVAAVANILVDFKSCGIALSSWTRFFAEETRFLATSKFT